MPKLDAKKRKSINERLALHEELRGRFKDRKYLHASCRLCGWASNGLTPAEAMVENRKHEATHPEIAQIRATEVDPWEIRDSLHDHECKMGLCVCKCGCQKGPFCVLVLGPLCTSCMIAANGGDNEHGELA